MCAFSNELSNLVIIVFLIFGTFRTFLSRPSLPVVFACYLISIHLYFIKCCDFYGLTLLFIKLNLLYIVCSLSAGSGVWWSPSPMETCFWITSVPTFFGLAIHLWCACFHPTRLTKWSLTLWWEIVNYKCLELEIIFDFMYLFFSLCVRAYVSWWILFTAFAMCLANLSICTPLPLLCLRITLYCDYSLYCPLDTRNIKTVRIVF